MRHASPSEPRGFHVLVSEEEDSCVMTSGFETRDTIPFFISLLLRSS
jgi:hypothetical protein